MLFRKPKPTVTSEDQQWIEEAFLWFEQQYGREYLKSVRIIEPTREFFDYDFTGSKADAEFALTQVMKYMDIKGAEIELYFFSDAPMEFEDEGIMMMREPDASGNNGGYTLGKYSEGGGNKFQIGIEVSQLRDTQKMIATIAHELSHLILLGEGRLDQNDEELTDLNCIALGFGIFTGNSIFSFKQWHGTSHQGWQTSRNGYIPEEVAAYAMALFNTYQNNTSNCSKHLNRSMSKLYKTNIKYLKSTEDEILFR